MTTYILKNTESDQYLQSFHVASWSHSVSSDILEAHQFSFMTLAMCVAICLDLATEWQAIPFDGGQLSLHL